MSKCSAYINIGADDGDNAAIMRCQLKAGHKGQHKETFFVQYPQDKEPKQVVITWRKHA